MCSDSKSDPSQQVREFLRADGDVVCAPMGEFLEERTKKMSAYQSTLDPFFVSTEFEFCATRPKSIASPMPRLF